MQPKPNSIYNFNNPAGIRLITRLRLGLSHLHKHKFKHSFLNPLCLWGNDIETSSLFLLHCPIYSNERVTLLNKIENISHGILELSHTIMTKTPLFGDSSLSDSTKTLILNSKDLIAPLLLNYKSKKHYLALEKNLFVLVY